MELEFSITIDIFEKKQQLNFGNLTLWLYKKVTWGLTYFDEFIITEKQSNQINTL